MAGAHQIWRMTLDEAPPGRMIGPYAGNGREDIVDGRLTPPYPYAPGYASFAQPSGLSSDGRRLFVADSEGASIRSVPLPGVRQAGSNGSDKSENGDASPAVTTIVGAARLPFARLFTFGDRDGQGLLSLRVPSFTFEGEAQQVDGPLLQHPLDVAYHDGKLYVADTYNDKVKVIELATSEVKTVDVTSAGDGEPIGLDEPAGLALAAGKLFVADTNNHRVCVVDLERDNRISVFTIEGLEPPKREE